MKTFATFKINAHLLLLRSSLRSVFIEHCIRFLACNKLNHSLVTCSYSQELHLNSKQAKNRMFFSYYFAISKQPKVFTTITTSYCRKLLEMRGLSESLRHTDNFNLQISILYEEIFHSAYLLFSCQPSIV